jgi:hypothetical protein
LELELMLIPSLAKTGRIGKKTHVATGEVTTLEHELGNHTVEGRALVTLALLGFQIALL